MTPLLNGDDFDLHQCVLGQAGHFDCAAGGVAAFREEGCVHLVHCAEVVHIAQEHGGLGYCVHCKAGGLQDRLDIGQGLTGLLLDAFRESSGGRVDGQLTGCDDDAAQVDGLAVGADGRRSSCGADDCLRKNAPPFLLFYEIILSVLKFIVNERFLQN